MTGASQPILVQGPPTSLSISIFDNNNRALRIQPELGKLVIVDYAPQHELTVLDSQWLRQHTAPGSDVSAYRPDKNYDTTPSKHAVICTMFEKRFRPAYCQR